MLQPGDLAGVLVDADDVDAEFRETGTRNQADITGTDDRNVHDHSLPNEGLNE